MDLDKLTTLLKPEEGCKLTMYLDGEGVPTLGWGHNLRMPISQMAADLILRDDITWTVREMFASYPFIATFSENRQIALGSMYFNLGSARFAGFRNMIAALEKGDFASAADEMLNSLAAKEDPKRYEQLAGMVRSG